MSLIAVVTSLTLCTYDCMSLRALYVMRQEGGLQDPEQSVPQSCLQTVSRSPGPTGERMFVWGRQDPSARRSVCFSQR